MDALNRIATDNTGFPASREMHINSKEKSDSPALVSIGDVARSPVRDSVKVNLSVEGLKAAAAHKKDSPAVNEAREIEKIREHIKELQKQIQEQQAQLQAVLRDQRSFPDEKTSRISAINQQLAGLESSLASATAQLMEALKGHAKTKGADGVQPLPFVQNDPTPTSSSSS